MQPSRCSKQELQVMVADLAFKRFTFFSSTGYTHHRLNIPCFLLQFSLLSIYKGNKSADASYIIIFWENFLIQKASLLFFVATVIGFSSNLIYQNTSLKDTSRLGNHLFIFISSSRIIVPLQKSSLTPRSEWIYFCFHIYSPPLLKNLRQRVCIKTHEYLV